MKEKKGILTLICTLLVIVITALAAFLGFGDSDLIGIRNVHLGLDLAGGVSITYQAQETEEPTAEQMEGALAIINNRLSSLGYTEAQAFIESGNRIRVEIPGVSDANEAVQQIGKTAMLTFVGVNWDEVVREGLTDSYIEPLAQQMMEELAAAGSTAYSESTIESTVEEYLSEAGSAFYYFPEATAEILQAALDQGIAEVILEGEDVENATAQHGQVSASGIVEDYVRLDLNNEGTQKFAEGTQKYVGDYIAIRLDQTIVSIPSVNTAITDGTAIITGMADSNEAKQLASDIRGGALPVQLEDIEHNSVGATLGQDALSTSLLAAVIGFVIVLIFMTVIYRVPGFIASLALIFYISAEILLINLLGITLTLSGIAGIILSIGMAVDANVIIFARINEELNNGRGLRAAVASGFKKALSAIIDGNITTLIAAAVLWFLGSGTIQGFAVTLALGIVISMFTALILSQLLLKSAVEVLPEKVGLYRSLQLKLGGKPIRIIAKTKLWFAISGVIILIGAGFFLVRGLNYDIDFAGGTMLQVDMEGDYDQNALTRLVGEVTGDDNPMVQRISGAGQDNQVSIKVKELSTEQIDALYQAIAEEFGLDAENQSNLVSHTSISPTVSSEMQQTAVLATLVAGLLTLIYITIRFRDVRFGLSSVLALLHDVLIVVAMYAIFRIPVNNNFIAAILTIVGYSINNTIVVFDRIRENRRYYRPDQADRLADDSIAQTMGRSLNTSITTIIMVLMLFILGVESIRWFAFPLLAGFVAGTYSSLVIASPMWVLLQKVGKNKKGKMVRAGAKKK